MLDTDNIDAVLFDLDGTLVESMSMWKDIDIQYLSKYNMEVPDDLQNVIEGYSMYQTAVYFKNRFCIEDTIEAMMNEWNEMAYYKYTHTVPLKKGVYAFLEYLKRKGVPCGISTSNSRMLTEAIVESHGIQDFFSVMVTGDEVLNGKPAPEVYLLAAEKLNADPKKCIVFEDIPVGILAGKNAGMTVYAVEDEYSLKDTCEKKKLSDYYIKTYEDLL